MVLRGSAMRPVCHFELKESPDYLSRRPGNLKNEFGMLSPIECTDIKVTTTMQYCLSQYALSLSQGILSSHLQ